MWPSGHFGARSRPRSAAIGRFKRSLALEPGDQQGRATRAQEAREEIARVEAPVSAVGDFLAQREHSCTGSCGRRAGHDSERGPEAEGEREVLELVRRERARLPCM